MAFLSCHYHFEGPECPSNFRFEGFDLTYDTSAMGDQELHESFPGPDPIKAFEAFKTFHREKLPEQTVNFSSNWDHMLMDDTGIEEIRNGVGEKVLVATPTDLKINDGAHLFSVVGGFSADGPEFQVIDRGEPVFNQGNVRGANLRSPVRAASLYRSRPLDEDELSHAGLIVGWVIFLVDTGTSMAEVMIWAAMHDFLQDRLKYWNKCDDSLKKIKPL